MQKDIAFLGSALDDLRRLPQEIRRTVGYQLHKIQENEPPDDWKPMPVIGAGVCELRVRDASGAYRLIYVAKFAEALYVLHVFRKKTQKTAADDIELARRRYREMMRTRS
ncbi:MAG TPA: type II toxin-antitoxin system RelE/ParE family toxin [Steroidobacteraceae bacterium]|jgi:phage-related protein